MANGNHEYIVIDLETSIKNKGDNAIGNFKASPFHPDNQIVMAGTKLHGIPKVNVYKYPTAWHMPLHLDNAIVVGHNIGFDLLYMFRDADTWRNLLLRANLWDTMIVEYLLSGQDTTFPSLDYVSEKYGGTLKDDKIKGYWKDNVDTEDIPEGELEEYLIHDVLNTERVFLAQFDEAYRKGMLPLIRTQMEARLATIMMEINGMHINLGGLRGAGALLKHAIDKIDKDLSDIMGVHFDLPPNTRIQVSPNSTVQLAAFMWGGIISYEEHVQKTDAEGKPEFYKGGVNKGRPKLKWEKKVKNVDPFFKNIDPGALEARRGSKGYWATDDAVCKRLKEKIDGDIRKQAQNQVLDMIMESRTLTKDYTAFYKGMGDLVWGDSCIHPTYNHAATGTGRLSCSKPNLQQVSGKDG